MPHKRHLITHSTPIKPSRLNSQTYLFFIYVPLKTAQNTPKELSKRQQYDQGQIKYP